MFTRFGFTRHQLVSSGVPQLQLGGRGREKALTCGGLAQPGWDADWPDVCGIGFCGQQAQAVDPQGSTGGSWGKREVESAEAQFSCLRTNRQRAKKEHLADSPIAGGCCVSFLCVHPFAGRSRVHRRRTAGRC